VHTAGGKGLQEFLGTKLLLLLVLGGKVARVVDDDALLGPGAGVSLYVLINLVVHKAWIPSFKLKPKDVSFSEGWATRAFGLDAFDIPTWLSLVEKYLRVSRAIPAEREPVAILPPPRPSLVPPWTKPWLTVMLRPRITGGARVHEEQRHHTVAEGFLQGVGGICAQRVEVAHAHTRLERRAGHGSAGRAGQAAAGMSPHRHRRRRHLPRRRPRHIPYRHHLRLHLHRRHHRRLLHQFHRPHLPCVLWTLSAPPPCVLDRHLLFLRLGCRYLPSHTRSLLRAAAASRQRQASQGRRRPGL